MHQYRHYSFDFWGTLFKANEEFKTKRNEYLQRYIMDKYGKVVAKGEIQGAITDVWRQSDAVSQFNGKSPDALELYALVLFRLTGTIKGLTPLEMKLLYLDLEKLFLENPPILYDNDTKMVLEELKMRGKTMSILSNTSFTKGRTLQQVLKENGIYDNIFLLTLFSDDHNMYKPNREFFKKLHDNLPYETEDIIHIGDNPIADGAGAQEYGFGHMIINSNSFTIKDLL